MLKEKPPGTDWKNSPGSQRKILPSGKEKPCSARGELLRIGGKLSTIGGNPAFSEGKMVPH